MYYDGTEVISHARVQVQLKGTTKILFEVKSDSKGQFKISSLRAGEYWLGVSIAGYNLHYWGLHVTPKGGTKKVRVALSLGT